MLGELLQLPGKRVNEHKSLVVGGVGFVGRIKFFSFASDILWSVAINSQNGI